MKVEAESTLVEKVFFIAVGLLIALSAILLTGCHTVQGVGKDLQAVSSPYVETD